MGGIIGEAFLLVSPETTGFEGGLESKLKGIFGGVPVLGAVAGLGIAVEGVLLGIGEKFEGLNNTIISKTGASGNALKGLEQSAKDVFSSTLGATFQNVGDTISELSVRTHLTGSALDDMARKEIELGKITKTDVGTNVQSTTALFDLFGVSASKQSGELDVLFKASQQSGVGFTTLVGNMQTAAPVAQMLGLNVNQTAAMVANLSAAGLPASKVMMGLSSEFQKAAKAGKDPTTVINDMVAQLKGAPSATAAATIAMKDFGIGSRQAATLVDAVRSGALNLGTTLSSITNGQGGIVATANATATIGDKFKLLKNQAETALQPIASKFLDLVTVLVDHLSPAIADISTVFQSLAPVFQRIGAVISATFGFLASHTALVKGALAALAIAGVAFGATFIPMLAAWAFWAAASAAATLAAAAPFIAIGVAVVAVGAGLVYAYEHFKVFRDIVQDVAHFFTDTLWPALKQVFDFLVAELSVVVDAFKSRWGEIQEVLRVAWTVISDIVKVYIGIVLTEIRVVLAVVEEIWRVFHATILRVLMAAWDQIKLVITTAINIVSDIIKLVLDLVTGHWSAAWNDVLDILKNIWNLISGTVSNALSIVGNLIASIGGIFLRAMEGALNAVVNTGASILSWFVNLPGLIASKLAGIASWLFNAGIQLIQGLINGIGSMAGAVGNAVVNTAKSAVNAITGPLGFKIHSPSVVFDEIGQQAIAGLVQGLGKTGAVSDAMNKLAGLTTGVALPQLSGASGGSSSAAAVGGGAGFGGAGAAVVVHQTINPAKGMSEAQVGKISGAEIAWQSKPMRTGGR